MMLSGGVTLSGVAANGLACNTTPLSALLHVVFEMLGDCFGGGLAPPVNFVDVVSPHNHAGLMLVTVALAVPSDHWPRNIARAAPGFLFSAVTSIL